MIIASPSADLVAGAFVALWWAQPGKDPSIKRLTRVPPLRAQHPDSEAFVIIELEMLNPARLLWTTLDKLSAIHHVVCILKPPQIIREAHKPQRRRAVREVRS
jgi:hypothetical protein